MGQGDRKRWYDDACGMAFALDMVGERWALLIMRELMYGPRRFSELRRDLPGISANILTQRLATLEDNGILQRRMLAPPASVQVYELTDWGYAVEPVMISLGSWAVRHPDHDPTMPLSGTSIMMSLRAMYRPERNPDGLRPTLCFRIGPDDFIAKVVEGGVDIARRPAEPQECDATITAQAIMIAALIHGKVPLEQWLADGMGDIDGDIETVRQFADFFLLPPKINCG